MELNTNTTLKLDDERPLPEIIGRLHAGGANGVLTITSREARRGIVFVNGEVMSATSNLEGEKLGSWLVGRRAISIQDKTSALMTKARTSSPFGHSLVTKNLISQSELEFHLQSLTSTIVERATYEYRTGIGFSESLPSDRLDTLPNMTTRELIVIAGRALSDQDLKRTAVGNLANNAWLAEDPVSVLDDLDLKIDERHLVELLVQPLSIEELLMTSGMERGDFVEALYPLIAAGIVVLGTGDADEAIVRSGAHPAVAELPGFTEMAPAQIEERELVQRTVVMTEDRSAHDVLGLPSAASPEEIRRASARLMRIFDPRRVGDWHLADLGPQLAVITERVREATRELLDSNMDLTAYVDGGRKDPARAHAKAGEDVSGYQSRIDRALLVGDIYLAHSLLERVCDLDPQPGLLVKLARIKQFNPNLAKGALEKLKLALNLDPELVEGWLTLADYWRRRRNQERQRKALERAIAANPDHDVANRLYVQLVGEEAARAFRSRAQRIEFR